MTPAYIRWRCERLDQLLKIMSRRDALVTIRAEELDKPWERDPRPAPPPLPMGSYYNDRPA
jgi:hypothetical protein